MQDYHLPWRLVPNKFHHYHGGREIDRFRAVEPACDDSHPEAWVGSTVGLMHPAYPMEGYARCIRPSGGECYLFEAVQEDRQAMLGGEADMSVLVKLLDAQKQLGFQCHPTREMAGKLFNSAYGKAESWIVVGLRDDVPEPPYVLLGFKAGISREIFEGLYRKGDIGALEGWTHKIPVQVGDVFFVDGGVPHAIGAGCFVVEVQEPSDITVGGQQLKKGTAEQKQEHDRRLLQSYVYLGRSYDDNLKACKVHPVQLRSGLWGTEKALIGSDQTTFFSCTRLDAVSTVEMRQSSRATIAIVTSGTAVLRYHNGTMEVKKADELFIPAESVSIAVEPKGEFSMLLCQPAGAT